MKLHNEFVVAAPVEQTWRTLLDLPRVASALPGATIEPGADGSYLGRLRLKVGPVSAEYTGTARVEDIDEDLQVASFYLQGSGGVGTASATITTRVEPVPGGTRVVVETDLRVTGRAASFGRGLLEQVSAGMLGEFARSLEAEILATAAGARHEQRVSDQPARASSGVEVLDVGGAAWNRLTRRYAIPVLVVLLVLALLRRPKVIVLGES